MINKEIETLITNMNKACDTLNKIFLAHTTFELNVEADTVIFITRFVQQVNNRTFTVNNRFELGLYTSLSLPQFIEVLQRAIQREIDKLFLR